MADVQGLLALPPGVVRCLARPGPTACSGCCGDMSSMSSSSSNGFLLGADGTTTVDVGGGGGSGSWIIIAYSARRPRRPVLSGMSSESRHADQQPRQRPSPTSSCTNHNILLIYVTNAHEAPEPQRIRRSDLKTTTVIFDTAIQNIRTSNYKRLMMQITGTNR